MGSTGYQPVPLGDPPDGTEEKLRPIKTAPSSSCAPAIPVGESPTVAGGSPALPVSKHAL